MILNERKTMTLPNGDKYFVKKKKVTNSYRTLKTTTATETTTKHGKKVFGNAWAKKSIKE